MPDFEIDPIWGEQGNPGPGAPSDFEIPSGSEDIVVDGSGKANLPVKIYNDKFSDGDNIFALTVDSSTIGFNQDVYEFQEKDGIKLVGNGDDYGSPDSSDNRTFPIELNTASTTQTAYVVIYDDEKPSRKTKGDDSANNIDLKGVNNSDTSDDTVLTGAGDDTVDAGKGNDIVFGQKGNDKIWGKEGNDYLLGGEGDDYLNGGDGKDYLDGGTGADTLEGGNGDDIYIVDNVNDKIIDSPGTGIETVKASLDWDLKDGSGLDHLYLTDNAIQGIGNNLNNKIYGNSQNNILEGKNGKDELSGFDGNDNIYGGSGDDKLDGGSGDDYLNGGDGNDILDGGFGGADTLEGGYGNDIYIVDNVNDKIIDSPQTGIETVKASLDWTLGAGLDNLILSQYADGFEDSDFSNLNGTGNNLNNTITGNGGKNILEGLSGNDTLKGNSGDDTLLGGDGNDFIFGGKGADSLTGGFGADTFVFESFSEGIDTIADFNYSEGDKIQISKVGFGATSTNQFSYNSSTGALLFDASSSDGIAAVQFATLSSGISFVPSLDINLV
ncbi:MAG: calcium-binding protein [Methylacidiphilales bacterium]|nr:calcium-binding protein [Candidatus Methylacidiphilales bacterium]